MCTVTFIPSSSGVFICSNRDEKSARGLAYTPQQFTTTIGQQIIRPADADAGGTWIAVNELGDAAVLLNGAFNNHMPQYPYRRSRGLIFLDIFESNNSLKAIDTIDLDRIEPFTMVLFVSGNLWLLKWDGDQKYIEQLDAQKPYIWSSVTLYDEATRTKRESWFKQWINLHAAPSLAEILAFHRFTGDGDKANDLLMNRNNQLLTVSITGIEIRKERITMKYQDLIKNKTYLTAFSEHVV